MHRLAPTVLAAQASRGELLDTLRTMGYAPVAESPEGAVVITRLDSSRAESPRQTELADRSEPDESVVTAAVRALRAGDEAARIAAPNGSPPRSSALAVVRPVRGAGARGARAR